MKERIKAGIIGASGYTGSELVRLLINHSSVEISFITSETHQGKNFFDIHPAFHNSGPLKLVSAQEAETMDYDVVFLALPHHVSMNFAPKFLKPGKVVIDLSGDFRLDDAATYEKWYNTGHKHPELLDSAVYGLPEINRENIKKANLIANPGCYPTSASLALLPLVANNMIDHTQPLIIDAKSGTTGAGIKPSEMTHFATHFGNFLAYKTGNHRHAPEITQTIKKSGDKKFNVLFSPHLLPVDRGILSTVYVAPDKNMNGIDLLQLYQNYYQDHPFVRIMNRSPEIKHVRGSNYCDIYPLYHKETNRIVILSAIDNLVKGAAGQAIQNMNLRFGLEESEGLTQIPLMP